jgi:hypothetical protein
LTVTQELPVTQELIPPVSSLSRADIQSGSREFANARAAMSSPLAKRLFAIDGVTGVFFGAEFITVTKKARGGLFSHIHFPS